jgi:hypothetical protein
MHLRSRSLSVAGGLLLAVAAVGLVARFPVPAVADELARQARQRLGVLLQPGAASFNVVGGLRVDDVVVSATGERLILSAQVERLVLQHRLSPSAALEITRIVLHEPSIDLTVGRRPAPDGPPPGPVAPSTDAAAAVVVQTGGSFLRFDGASVEVTGATVDARLPTSDAYPIGATALDASLADVRWNPAAPSLLHRLSGTGHFSADELLLGRARVTSAGGDLTIGDGLVRIERLIFACGDSSFLLPELEIDFTADPFSLGTGSNVFERPPDSASPDDWTPVTSFARLSEICEP